MQVRKSVLFAAVALSSVLAFSGCSPADTGTTPSSPVAEAPSVADVAAGDTVSAEQAALLNESEAKPGFRAFKMSDGAFVVIDSAVPLPDAVATEIQRQVDALPATDEAVGAFVFEKNAETGRNIVVVTHLGRWVHIGDSKQEAFMRPSSYVGNGSVDDYLAELYADGVADTVDSLEMFVQPVG